MFRQARFKISRKDGYWDCEVTPIFDVDEIRRGKSKNLDFGDIKKFLNGEVDEATGEVNWAGSGSAVILKTKEGIVLPVGYRDSGAPTHAEKLCTASGIADDVDELLEPRILSVKELEEIMLYDTVDNKWLLPIEDEYFDRPMAPGIKRTASEWENKSPLVLSYSTSRADTRFKKIGKDKMTINHPKRDDFQNQMTGHLIIDEETKNLDLVDIVEIDLEDRKIEDIRLFDGELSNGELLDRPIYLFQPDMYTELFSGDEVTAHRKMLSGLYYDGNGYSASYSDGNELSENFDGVPTLLKSHENICKYVDENY